jgi:hypothetical protein
MSQELSGGGACACPPMTAVHPLICTSEYIANSPGVIEHLWLLVDMSSELRIPGGEVRIQMGLVELLGDWMGTGGRLPGDGAARGWLS